MERLFRPRSIAVIGGGAWCANVIRECRKIGFDRALWAVHPTRHEIAGLPCVATVDDLPEAPDASFVGVNRHATVEVIRALAARGAGGAICFASGFAEAEAELSDGPEVQAELLAAAGKMPILGPNCYGILNALDGVALWPDQHGLRPVESGVAIVAQSSNIALNLTMQRRGLPIAYLATVGNQAQTGLARVGQTLLQDPRVTALGLYVEGVGDLRAFEALAATARDLGKPIVVLKTGRSEQARAGAVSHTASLSGSDDGASALFRRLGMARAQSLGGFLEALKLLHLVGPLESDRIASMSCSGGEAALMADSAVGRGICFPPLNDVQKKALKAALGPKVALANPLDYHTYIWGDGHAMAACFTAMMQADLALGCVVLDFPRADRCDAREWDLVIEAVDVTRERTGRPMAILSSLPDTLPEDVADRIAAHGIVPLCGLTDALEAIALAVEVGRPRGAAAPIALPRSYDAGAVLHEHAAKTALAAHGVDVPKAQRVGTVAEAAQSAARIGFPVALKGDGVAHKTEAGLVVLDLDTEGEVATAAQAMNTEAFLVEEMIAGGSVELLIGVLADPAHGYVLTLGAGGTLTEILQDSAQLLLPVTAAEVADALAILRIAPLSRARAAGHCPAGFPSACPRPPRSAHSHAPDRP
ncbi:MAG: acetate--CoA ligase family protein, partial [Paracoccaceae bacterium]|nr:acetate--CoA ligase family protein [Paracoccaceae bacterium]